MNITIDARQINTENLEKQFKNKLFRIETKSITDTVITVFKITYFLFNIPVFRYYKNNYAETANHFYNHKESQMTL